MKNLCRKSKGKIHPSPSYPLSSSSSPSSSSPSSLLYQLLPAAILVLISALSPEEKEVLAYHIFHSIKPDHTPSILQHPQSKKCKKKTPLFHCKCFDCYTSFWTRWDSSPNRSLIDRALEAFEDHLRSSKSTKPKKKDRRFSIEPAQKPHQESVPGPEMKKTSTSDTGSAGTADSDTETERVGEVPEPDSASIGETASVPSPKRDGEVSDDWLEEMASVPTDEESEEKEGLVKKVWPDVMGLFNSRFWSLWSPGE